jgi:hypothetical protein
MQLSSKNHQGMTIDHELGRVPTLLEVRQISFRSLCYGEGWPITSQAGQ